MAAVVEDSVVTEPEERAGKVPVPPGNLRGKSAPTRMHRLAGAQGREPPQPFLQLGRIVQQAGVHGVTPILDRLGILRAVGDPLGVRVECGLLRVLRPHGGQQCRERSGVADLRIVRDEEVLHARPGEGSLHVVRSNEAEPRGNRHHFAPVEGPQPAPQLTHVAEPNVVGRFRKDVIDEVEPRYRRMIGQRRGQRCGRGAPCRRVASRCRIRRRTAIEAAGYGPFKIGGNAVKTHRCTGLAGVAVRQMVAGRWHVRWDAIIAARKVDPLIPAPLLQASAGNCIHGT